MVLVDSIGKATQKDKRMKEEHSQNRRVRIRKQAVYSVKREKCRIEFLWKSASRAGTAFTNYRKITYAEIGSRTLSTDISEQLQYETLPSSQHLGLNVADLSKTSLTTNLSSWELVDIHHSEKESRFSFARLTHQMPWTGAPNVRYNDSKPSNSKKSSKLLEQTDIPVFKQESKSSSAKLIPRISWADAPDISDNDSEPSTANKPSTSPQLKPSIVQDSEKEPRLSFISEFTHQLRFRGAPVISDHDNEPSISKKSSLPVLEPSENSEKEPRASIAKSNPRIPVVGAPDIPDTDRKHSANSSASDL